MLKFIEAFAKGMDTLRLFPRAFMAVYLVILYDASNWFLLLTDPTAAQSAYMSVIVTAGVGWMTAYVMSGKKE